MRTTFSPSLVVTVFFSKNGYAEHDAWTASATGYEIRLIAMSLIGRCFEYHRRLESPARRDEPDVGLYGREILILEHSVARASNAAVLSDGNQCAS